MIPSAHGGSQQTPEPLTSAEHPKLLFFDGDCSFCTRWVGRVMKADEGHLIRYAWIQGKTYERVLERRPELAKRNTLVLVQRRDAAREDIFTRSTAVRRLIDGLPGFGIFAFVLHIVPTFLSDIGYRFVATFRDVLFGRWAANRPPVEKNRDLFLD